MLNIDRVEAIRKVPAKLEGRQCWAVAVSNEIKVTGHIVAAFSKEKDCEECLKAVEAYWLGDKVKGNLYKVNATESYSILEVADNVEKSIIQMPGSGNVPSIKR